MDENPELQHHSGGTLPWRGGLVFAALLGLVLIARFWATDPESMPTVAPLDFQVDVNQATAAELQVLPDVGQKLAQRIVSYREQYGAFESLESMAAVRGLGPKTLAGLEGLLFFSSEATETDGARLASSQ